MATRQIWDEFMYQNRFFPTASQSIYESPKLIIFEDDAMEIHPDAIEIAWNAVLNMTVDQLYLGYCFDREPGKVPPLCLHAYAMTIQGVRIVSREIDWCVRRRNCDEQFSDLGAAGILSWATMPTAMVDHGPSPYGFTDEYIRNRSYVEGFSLGNVEKWEGGEGGLFYQIKYEDEEHVVLQEGKVYKVKYPATTVYLFKNGSLRAFPNAKTFAATGLEWNQVIQIPRSQLRLHMGAELPAS
jgi:hypothetical protein